MREGEERRRMERREKEQRRTVETTIMREKI